MIIKLVNSKYSDLKVFFKLLLMTFHDRKKSFKNPFQYGKFHLLEVGF